MEARFFPPVQTGPETYLASYTMRTGSFPGVKRPGRGVDHPPQSRAEVKERVELYLYSPFGTLWPVLGELYLLPLLCGELLFTCPLRAFQIQRNCAFV
jgi:hypothetical protein